MWFSQGNLHYENGEYSFAANQKDAVLNQDYVNGPCDRFTWDKTAANFSITNGGNQSWRTLSSNEWYYLLFSRNNGGHNGYNFLMCKLAESANGQGDGVWGVILFPDQFVMPTNAKMTNAGGSLVSIASENYCNKVNDSDYSYHCGVPPSSWALLEANGAIFLPRTYINPNTGKPSSHYWSIFPAEGD